MRGFDPDQFLHVTHRGDPGFVAVAFEAASIFGSGSAREVGECLDWQA